MQRLTHKLKKLRVPRAVLHVFILFCFFSIWVAIFSGKAVINAVPEVKSDLSATNSLPQTGKTSQVLIADQPVRIPVGIPVRLSIPLIGVYAPIVREGVTATGNMDVPNNTVDVGWFEYGARPGAQGNAVLDGHLNYSASPGVFANLDKLTVGNTVYVIDENGRQWEFKVNHTEMLAYNETNLDEIFGATNAYHLVIITCAGTWLPTQQTYSQRLIVFADKV